MSSFTKKLFGGSKEKTSSTSGPVDITPPELAGLRGPFASALSSLFSGSGGDPLGGIPTFTQSTGNPLAAAIGSGEQQILDLLQQELLGGGGAARRDLLSRTLGGDFLPGSGGANPFLEAAITAAQRPTLEGLEQTLTRSLPGRFTAAGQFVQPQGTSAFDQAAADVTTGVAAELADIATNLSFATQEAERGRQSEALQLSQQEVETTVQNLQAQALPRLIQDLGIERGLQEFQGRVQAVLQALQIATGAPLIAAGTQSQSQGSGTSDKGIVPTLLAPFSFSGSI